MALNVNFWRLGTKAVRVVTVLLPFAVCAPTQAALSVVTWQPTGSNRYVRQCIATDVVDLPTCASPNEGFTCSVLATDALYLCNGGAWAAVGGGAGGAPTTADYLVKTADGGLSAERAVTDTSTITWDWATAGQAKASAVDVTCTNCLSGTEIDESTLGTVPSATSAGSATSASSASDLSCTNCIGGTEIDESTLSSVPTASALSANPSPCTSGDFVSDIAADGTLTCTTPAGGSGLTHPQVMARLAVGGGY